MSAPSVGPTRVTDERTTDDEAHRDWGAATRTSKRRRRLAGTEFVRKNGSFRKTRSYILVANLLPVLDPILLTMYHSPRPLEETGIAWQSRLALIRTSWTAKT